MAISANLDMWILKDISPDIQCQAVRIGAEPEFGIEPPTIKVQSSDVKDTGYSHQFADWYYLIHIEYANPVFVCQSDCLYSMLCRVPSGR
jgi:hypothetical protein